MVLVATGNPKKGFRSWLVSIVNSAYMDREDDPLDRFHKGTEAAVKVLDGVSADLRAHGRMREYQADFLLYSIIDRAVSEAPEICQAYARRLRWLQDELDKKRL